MQQTDPREHRETLPASYFRSAATAIIDMLGGRINRENIRSWERGIARPPAWVTTTVAEDLERKARAQLDLANRIRKWTGPGRGDRTGRHLRAYRERKAREREAKEKAPD